MEIKLDPLDDGKVIALLEEHLSDMYAMSPPESVHALDIAELKSDEVTFFSCWLQDELMGCIALSKLDSSHAELKSMRTSKNSRNKGIASALLQHTIGFARQNGFSRLSLETGSHAYFKPARNLYRKFGFQYCGSFADYAQDSYSKFMTLDLSELKLS